MNQHISIQLIDQILSFQVETHPPTVQDCYNYTKTKKTKNVPQITEPLIEEVLNLISDLPLYLAHERRKISQPSHYETEVIRYYQGFQRPKDFFTEVLLVVGPI